VHQVDGRGGRKGGSCSRKGVERRNEEGGRTEGKRIYSVGMYVYVPLRATLSSNAPSMRSFSLPLSSVSAAFCEFRLRMRDETPRWRRHRCRCRTIAGVRFGKITARNRTEALLCLWSNLHRVEDTCESTCLQRAFLAFIRDEDWHASVLRQNAITTETAF